MFFPISQIFDVRFFSEHQKFTEMDEVTKSIEVVAINDFVPTSSLPIVPHERQIVDAVITIWKEDPSTESLGISKLHAVLKKKLPNWSVSEKRVKSLLKKYGLLTVPDSEQYTYAKEITSQATPNVNLPQNVTLVMTSKRGKALYAKGDIKQGELLWEECPLFLIPPLAHTELIGSGKACTYCGKLANDSSRSKSGISVLKGLDCNHCQETWCSIQCKRLNQSLHASLKHPSHSASARKIDPNAFASLTEYCIKEQWNALYAITLIYADCFLDKSGVKAAQFRAMARVSQAVRYKALKSSAGAFDSMQGGALFVEELQEQLWEKGYELFCDVFPSAKSDGNVSFDEFMFMMGTYNINNLDSSVFLLQSHLNHSCSPNTKVTTSPKRYEGLKVFAARNIASGEELNTTYVNPSHTVQQRLRELRVNWGFLCKCQKCKDDAKLQQRRKSSSASNSDRKEIRKLLDKTSQELGGEEVDLEIPLDYNGERRKSVRFNEKVVKVT